MHEGSNAGATAPAIVQPMEEAATANSESTEQKPHTLERQASWALPEIPPSPCSLIAWGRADLGQIGIGSEAASSGPVSVDALQSKDIVFAAGSVYNSAYVTRTPPSSRLPVTCHCCLSLSATTWGTLHPECILIRQFARGMP